MNAFKQKLQKALSAIEERDHELSAELVTLRKSGTYDELADELEKDFKVFTDGGGLEISGKNYALESIIFAVGRPVLHILENEAVLSFTEAKSEIWRAKLTASAALLSKANRAIGRIELQNHLSYSWVGTGWVVDEGIVVTNRHVAAVFGKQKGSRFVFRSGFDGNEMTSSVDFLKEYGNAATAILEIEEILFIEEEDGPDLAFLKLKTNTYLAFPEKIALSELTEVNGLDVAVIGYPAKDSRIPNQDLMGRIFGDVFDKKRLAPGTIIGHKVGEIYHDCSTLGGNSGAAVIDLNTGKAVGIHFSGSFLDRNFAVPSVLIKERLGYALSGKAAAKPAQKTDVQTVPPQPSTYQFTVPVNIAITIGEPIQAAQSIALAGTEDTEIFTEGIVSEYADRKGYLENFLGDGHLVPLPSFKSKALEEDLLLFGEDEYLLKYTHFSVVMSKSRRICIYSAVNIDGTTGISMKRFGWKIDPRIPKESQIIKECYGNSPKFARGHMTRREDPIWGPLAVAMLGNKDSMHVTNTVPQMQSLNGVVWLALEDYALKNARKDKMKISVFTGPVLLKDDPMRYGVQIPVSFWKVIAFIHDEKKQLTATGYLMSQQTHLKNEEFVFGAHNEEQVTIARIEQLTGLSFHQLAKFDTLNKGAELPTMPLTDFDQIRFV